MKISNYHIEPAFEIANTILAKFKEINLADRRWMQGEEMARHMWLLTRYNEILCGYIMMRQTPTTFDGFK